MGLHRNPKSEEDLTLDDKLDLVRTMVRFNKRSESRRELNAIEPQVVEQHRKEVAGGKLTQVAISQGALLAAFGIGDDNDEETPALDSGDTASKN